MAVYTIADLHLSAASDHPMDVFGSRWKNYTEKLCRNWRSVVTDDDTVILPGDISWGMTLAEAREDFALIDALPGRKLIGKGNHDFWWETAAKLNRFFEENGFSTLSLLYNNAVPVEDLIVCGARGWFLDEEQQQTVGEVDYRKIVNREALRLRISLDAARKLRETAGEREIVVFFHFPPLYKEFRCAELLDVLKEYGVTRCYFGHIHGAYGAPAYTEAEGIRFTIVSSDYLRFTPLLVPSAPAL